MSRCRFGLAPLVRQGLFSWGLHCLGERAEAATQVDLPVQAQCALERLRIAWQSSLASGVTVCFRHQPPPWNPPLKGPWHGKGKDPELH